MKKLDLKLITLTYKNSLDLAVAMGLEDKDIKADQLTKKITGYSPRELMDLGVKLPEDFFIKPTDSLSGADFFNPHIKPKLISQPFSDHYMSLAPYSFKSAMSKPKETLSLSEVADLSKYHNSSVKIYNRLIGLTLIFSDEGRLTKAGEEYGSDVGHFFSSKVDELIKLVDADTNLEKLVDFDYLTSKSKKFFESYEVHNRLVELDIIDPDLDVLTRKGRKYGSSTENFFRSNVEELVAMVDSTEKDS
jgi:hypothetical protein